MQNFEVAYFSVLFAVAFSQQASDVTQLESATTTDQVPISELETSSLSDISTSTVGDNLINSTLISNETADEPITFLPPPNRDNNSLADNSTDDANARFLAAPGVVGDVDKSAILDVPSGLLLPTVTSNSVSFRLGVIDPFASGSGDEDDTMNFTMMADKPGDFLSSLFGGGAGAPNEAEDGNLKCFSCESCPESTEKMRKETCADFSALCMTKESYTMRRGKLYFVRRSRFCGPSSCPPSSLMTRFHCCSGDLCNGTPSRTDAERVAIALAAIIAAIWSRIFHR